MSKPRNSDSLRPRIIMMGLVTLLLMAGGVQWAIGQGAASGYESFPYDATYLAKNEKTGEIELNDKYVKVATLAKNQVLIGALPYAGESVDQFKKWYTGYQFRAFSQVENLHKLPQRRKDIIDDLRRAKTKELHDVVLATTEQFMKGYVTSARNFHPAVRFNAMLVMGDLNAEEQGITLRYAIPLPTALDFMLAEYQKPTQLDSVKLAAMIGIMRHAQLNWARLEANRIPAAKQQQIADLMLALVNEKNPPAGRTRDGHVWMQRRAVEILATLGLVGTNDPVTQAITGLVRDHDADLTLRCTAAEALGKTYVRPPAKSKLDASKESLQLAALLVEACRKELERMEAWQKKKTQGSDPYGGGGMPGGMMQGMMGGSSGMSGMGMSGMSGMGMEGGMSGAMYGGAGAEGSMPAGPKDPLVELFRRQIKFEIDCVRKGIGGVGRLAVGVDPKKGPFPELTKDIDAVWKATDPTANTVPSLHKSIKDSLKGLEKKTAALLPKPKEEPVSDEPGDVPAAAPAAAAGAAAVPAAVAPGATVPGAAAVPAGGAGVAAAPAGAAPAKAAPGAVVPGAARPGTVPVPGAAVPGAAVPGAVAPGAAKAPADVPPGG